MTWSRRIRRLVDRVTGRYQAFVVESAADRAACLMVLEEVRRLELNRVTGSSPLDSDAFAKVDVDDLILACRDTRTGEIVGCVRSTSAEQLAEIPTSRAEYRLDLLPPEHLSRAGIATRLAFEREHRGSIGAYLLVETMYAEGLARGYLYCLLSCEPSLHSMYARLGFRPLGRVRAAERRGLRVPMIMINHDREHLRAIRSPFLRALERAGQPLPMEGVRFHDALLAEHGPIDPGIAGPHDLDEAVHRALTDGMSKRGIAQLLDNAVVVSCSAGDLLFREHDGGRFLGLVVDGEVDVVRGGAEVSILDRGQPFGVISTVLETHRTASVFARSTHTRVLFLGRSAVGKVRAASDREALWRNLARHAARRS
jgi:hypothetical protein